jgi:hypothetical protein
MVYFQCEKCIATLKKKQVENHYLHECKNAQYFRCITCQKLFDRETIKAHTSCITEEEKYHKGDNMVKKSKFINKPKEKIECDVEELKWSGFKKTSKIILMSYDNYKCDINELIDKLAIVFAKNHNDIPDNCDKKKMKTILLDKVENCKFFFIDIPKNTLKYKP